MFPLNVYQVTDRPVGGGQSKAIVSIVDNTNNKVIWERAIEKTFFASATGQTGYTPTRDATLLRARIDGAWHFGLTPSPTNPCQYVCNNGTLQLKDDELPVGYHRLTEIDFDGDTWYETSEALTGDDIVTMTLAGTSTTGQNVFGSYNGTADGRKNFSLFIYGGGSTSKTYLRYNESLYRPTYGSGQRTITFGAGGTTGFSENVEIEQAEFTTPANAYIGMLPNSSSPAYTGRIIGEITVGTRLKWIPCERISDGAIGYYETYNSTFIEASGTGAPTKGEYDHTHERVVAIGTPNVVTFTTSGKPTQVANVETLIMYQPTCDHQDIISGVIQQNIGRMALNGTEAWEAVSDTVYQLSLPNAYSGGDSPKCTHFALDTVSPPTSNKFIITSTYYLQICVSSATTLADFKAWLVSQYAAGTPVLVFYRLAQPITIQVTPQPIQGYRGAETIVSITGTTLEQPQSTQDIVIYYLGK